MRGNPLRFTDPTGEKTDSQLEAEQEAYRHKRETERAQTWAGSGSIEHTRGCNAICEGMIAGAAFEALRKTWLLAAAFAPAAEQAARAVAANWGFGVEGAVGAAAGVAGWALAAAAIPDVDDSNQPLVTFQEVDAATAEEQTRELKRSNPGAVFVHYTSPQIARKILKDQYLKAGSDDPGGRKVWMTDKIMYSQDEVRRQLYVEGDRRVGIVFTTNEVPVPGPVIGPNGKPTGATEYEGTSWFRIQTRIIFTVP